MPKTFIEGDIARASWIQRQLEMHDTDIKRLWRRIQQLEDALRASGVAVPPPPE